MNINELNNILAIKSGILTLTSTTLPDSSLKDLLIEYNNNSPIVITKAEKDITESSITVTGQSSFLEISNLNVTAVFELDKNGNPTATIKYNLIGETTSPNDWKFSRSFPNLPSFQQSKSGINYLDSLLLSNTTYILCTNEGTDNKTGQKLASGLNFSSDLAPEGIAGIFNSLLGGKKKLFIEGTINIPFAGEVSPLIPYETFPWQMEQPIPGISLKINLGIDIDLSDKLTLKDTELRIYTPVSQEWLKNNNTYQPVVALTGSMNIPSMGITVDLTAYVNTQVNSTSIIGAFEDVSFKNFEALTDFANGGGMMECLPQEIQDQVKKMSNLSLERASISMQGTPNSAGIDAISFTVGLPGVSWEIVNGFIVSDISTEFIVVRPFAQAGRLVSLLFKGTLTIAGTSFDVMLQVPDFAIHAQMERDATIQLNNIFKEYLSELPAPPDLTINEMTFYAVPGLGSYNFFINLSNDPGWTLDVTPAPLTISDVRVDVSKGTDTQARFSGSLAIGKFVDLDASYETPGDFMVRSTLPSLNLNDLIKLLSNIGLTLPADFDFTFDNNFIVIEESSGNFTLSFGTKVDDFGLMILTAQKEGAQWGFGFGMEIVADALSQIPGLGIIEKFVDFVGLEDLLLVVSSIDTDSFTFPDTAAFNAPSLGNSNITLPAQANGLVRGINVYAKLSAFKSQGIQSLAKYLGIDANGQIGITLAVSLPDPSSNSKLFLSVSAKPNSDTTLIGELGVLMQGTSIGAFLNGNLKTSVQGQTTSFDVTAVVVPNGAFISGTMKGTITFDPIQLSNLAIVIGINLEGIPSFGIAATIDVSTFDSSVAVFFDSINPSKSMVAGAISNLTLSDVVTAIAGQSNVPSELSAVLSEIGIKGLQAFNMPAKLGNDLDNRNLANISGAFKQYGSIDLPSASNQILLRVNKEGSVWSLTDMTTMMHYTLNINKSEINVALEAQLYIAPQTTHIGTLKFPQAIHVIAEINYLFLKEKIKVIISPSEGIAVDMSIAPITLLNKDFISITGAGETGGPQLSLSTYEHPNEPIKELKSPHFLLSGEMRILSIDVLEVYVFVSTCGATFKLHEQISPLVSFNLNGTISALDKMSGEGSVKVGIDKSLNLGSLGSIDLDVNVSGTIDVSLNGTNAQADITGKFVFQGISFSIPKLSIDVNGKGLANLTELVFDQVKDAIEAFLKDPDKWLTWVGSNVIKGLTGGADEVGKILKDTYNLVDNEIIDKTKDILNYTADQVSLALKGAGIATDVAAAAMKAAGYTACEIASGLKVGYNFAADQVAEALEGLGYGVNAITKALESAFKGIHVDINAFPPHVDTSQHIDTPAGPHADSNVPPHVDTSQHIDTPAGSHADSNVPPHGDTSQHIDTPSGPHADSHIPPHGDKGSGWLHWDTPAGLHADSRIPPHGDTNPHVDIPSGPHADSNVPPHVDTSQHLDTPAGPHADSNVPPHGDTTPHVDTPSGHIDIKP